MKTICLLVRNREELSFLWDLLKREYSVVSATEVFPQTQYDLYITDSFMFDRYHKEFDELKQKISPVFFPVLLASSRKELDLFTDNLLKTVDEVITIPVSVNELKARIRILLRMREQSLQLHILYTECTKRKQESKKSEAKLEAILNSIPDGYVVYEQDGTIGKINNMGKKFLGFTEDTLNLSYRERFLKINIFTPDNKVFPIEQLPSYRALHGENVRGVVLKTLTPDGEFWLSASASTISINGMLLGAIVELSDVTSVHKLQQQLISDRNFIEAVLQTSGALIAVLDTDARILRFNRACEILTGYSLNEVNGKSIFELFIIDDECEDVKRVFNQLKKNCRKTIEHENHWQTKSGGKRYIRFSNSVICNDNDEIEFIIATGIDITDRKILQEQLSNRVHEIDFAYKELESFSYSVSHDLQEPVRAISGFLSHLKNVYGGALNEDAWDDVNEAISGAQRMQVMIQDLLAISRVSSKGASFKQVDMNSALDEALENLSAMIRESGAVITKEKLTMVSADKTQMVLLFQNLIGNAIKFRSNRVPRVRIWADHKEKRWVFAVSDNGIGIDLKYFNTIFQIFQRLFTHEEYSGTGIGLAICKRIVERHGGQIWVESKEGEGSTFYFSIPE